MILTAPSSEVTLEVTEIVSEEAPKKRGRPKKVTAEEVETVELDNPVEPETPDTDEGDEDEETEA